ncbi:hypothetical protein DY000_02028033 [Brassica cretica]|uniref:Uncharacterized protein n=1 Tax=Brassica cretica TaxID=69181 RepID=A0ABQ7E5Z0_BRACR|nr:hypothetical protein DY000_02028033 [Brassica cretica]
MTGPHPVFSLGPYLTRGNTVTTPAPHVQAQPSVKPTSAFTTTRQNLATVTKGVKAQNRGNQEDKRCTFVTAHQVALGNRFEALRDQDV